MRHARVIVPLALLLLIGCEQNETAPSIATRAGDYVLRVDSSSEDPAAYWGAHVARASDTFPATIAADGRMTIGGLRVSGYATPGVQLEATSGGYRGLFDHQLTGIADPAFFTSSGGYAVRDTVSLTDTNPLTGAIASTATRVGSATLQDTLGFTLLPRPDLTGSGAGRYRLTVETINGIPTAVEPFGATFDLALSASGVATINLDATTGGETVATWANSATTLRGQYSAFDDATIANHASIPIELTLSGSGGARTVTSAAWSVVRNTTPATIEEQYQLSAQPLAFFAAFASASPTGIFELYGGSATTATSIPANWRPLVDRIVAATDGGVNVTADFVQSLSGAGTLSDVELRIDNQGTIGVLDGLDLHLPIGQTSVGGTRLIYAFIAEAVSDGSIHTGLPTTIIFEFTYTAPSTFGTGNGKITFVSTAGTGTVTFSFNPAE